MASIGLKSRTKRALERSVARLPLHLLTRLVPRDVIVLMYHAVGERPVGHLRNLYRYKTPAQFEADLISLKQHYSLPTWSEVTSRKEENKPRSRPHLLITFDDGLSDCFETVRPLLLKHRIPCMFFVTRDFVDNRSMFFRHKASLCIERFCKLSPSDQNRVVALLASEYTNHAKEPATFSSWMLGLGYADEPTIDRVCILLDLDVAAVLDKQRPYMTKEQIEQLHAEGFTIGGHTLSHPPLWILTPEEAQYQIVQSCMFVRELLSAGEVPFAFPFSANGVNRSILRSVTAQNPWISAMFGSNDIDLEERYLLNRINVDEPPNEAAGSNALWVIKKSYAAALLSSIRKHAPFG